MCFESISSIYLCKDRSTLTCPKWFSALISLTSSRFTNFPSRSSDLTCRRNAVSNLYVSSATLPHEDWQVSNSSTPINEESKEHTFEKFFRTHFASSNSRTSLRPWLGVNEGSCNHVVITWHSSLFLIYKPMILSVLLMKPTHTQPNSPVISIINRSISALIRSRTWASRASTNSNSCCATDLISNSNRRPTSTCNDLNDAEGRQGGLRAVGVENQWSPRRFQNSHLRPAFNSLVNLKCFA